MIDEVPTGAKNIDERACAGALLADNCPIRYSRLFCTYWNGLDKSGGQIDALDSAEYSGSLIMLLNEGVGFVREVFLEVS